MRCKVLRYICSHPTYCPNLHFHLTVTLLFLLSVVITVYHSFSILISIRQSLSLSKHILHHNRKRLLLGKRCEENVQFCKSAFLISICSLLPLLVVTHVLILRAGDVHPNPGPQPSESSCSLSSSDLYNFLKHPNHLSTIHYNVQSITNKIDTLIAEFSFFDIISFSETWLHDSVSSDDLHFPSFHPPERKDRVNNRYGGVILYVKNNLSYTRRHDLEIGFLECIWIQIKLVNNKNILYGVFYRPPNSDVAYTTFIEDSIDLAINTNITDVIITGDFNFNTMNENHFRKVQALCNQFNLFQCIDEPTHFTENAMSTIDLLFVTNKNSILTTGVGEPCLDLSMRYHCPVFGVFNFIKPKLKHIQRTIWKYDQGDYNQLRACLANFNWRTIIDDNIDNYAGNFANVITSKTRMFIPSKIVSINLQDPPWMTSFIKRKIRWRKRLYKKAKLSNKACHWSKFRSARNEVITIIRQTKENYYDQLSSKLKSSSLTSRDWWKTLKLLMSSNSSSSIPPLFDNSCDSMVFDENEKANVLNCYFANQSRVDDSLSVLPNEYYPLTQSSLDTLTILPSEVKDALKSLKRGKASGPDGINNRILIEVSNQIAPHLCDLFNPSLNVYRLPSSWKISNVSPIFKSGDPSLPSNYRPVSLLNSIEKVFERIIFKHVSNHLKDIGFFTPFQSGFMPGDSTVNQVSCLYNNICKALDDGLEFRAVFFDISKAFDKVWHKGLLFKLQRAGINGKLLSWFSNYLSNRYQRVVIPGGISSLCHVQAGVPQGSILGPLLFLVYINDIVDDIQSNINLFADDTSLSMVVDDPTNVGNMLQSDIDKISRWAQKWLVKFNPSKSESLVISRKRNKPNHPNLFMSNIEIPSVSSHKHLGIFLSNDGSWDIHINKSLEKAWRRVGIMRHLKVRLNRQSLQTIYFSFIRPLLEYGDVIWDNLSQGLKDELDKLQNEAARIVTGCTKLVAIADLYEETGWETLSERRRKHKLILFYKMMNGLSPNYLNSLVPPTVGNSSVYNLRSPNNLRNIPCRTSFYKNSFLPAVISDWNSLTDDMKSAETLTAFKYRLNLGKPVPKQLYFYGDRKIQIIHARLRNRCSSLNHHLYVKKIVQSPLCTCGSVESTEHFFLQCPNYVNIRNQLNLTINDITRVSLRTILYGDESLSLSSNEIIFDAVHSYIRASGRFRY